MPEFNLLPDETRNLAPHQRRRLTGQKPPLKPKEVWAIRIRLQIHDHKRDLALFNLAIDSKLRSCDLVALKVSDVVTGGSVRERSIIVQQKTGRPVQFELTEQTELWLGVAAPPGVATALSNQLSSTVYVPALQRVTVKTESGDLPDQRALSAGQYHCVGQALHAHRCCP